MTKNRPGYRKALRRRRLGFTLIEMLVVIAVIGILMGLLLPVIGSAREQGRRTACRSNLGQVGKALAIYATTFSGYLPSCPQWGLSSTQYEYDGDAVTNYPGHQGISRHMVLGYSGLVDDPDADLLGGNTNFMPAGLGILMARGKLSGEVLVCPSMGGTAPTWYDGNQYEYNSGFPKLIQRGMRRMLVTADGTELHEVPVADQFVVAVVGSYSYRNSPFYCRLEPDNAPPGWSYVSDHPDLADWSDPRDPWIAEWTLEFTKGKEKAEFMTPPFQNMRELDNRAIASDSFDYSETWPGGNAMVNYHHGEGYNVVYGDNHVSWFDDEAGSISTWSEWADSGNYGTDDLTISSMSSHRVWNQFDRAEGIDVP